MMDEGEVRDDRAHSGERPGGVTPPMASLAHALRNPVQALTHALYVLRLPNLSADEQRRMLLLQERQLSLLAHAVETHLAATATAPAVGDAPLTTVQSVVGAILRECTAAPGASPHRCTVRMDDPGAALLADEPGVAHDVGVRWREAIGCQTRASRSLLTVRRAEGRVELELVVEADDEGEAVAISRDPSARRDDRAGPAGTGPAPDRGSVSAVIAAAVETAATADARLVYRTSIRLRPPRA
jgi:hypothetical protein